MITNPRTPDASASNEWHKSERYMGFSYDSTIRPREYYVRGSGSGEEVPCYTQAELDMLTPSELEYLREYIYTHIEEPPGFWNEIEFHQLSGPERIEAWVAMAKAVL